MHNINTTLYFQAEVLAWLFPVNFNPLDSEAIHLLHAADENKVFLSTTILFSIKKEYRIRFTRLSASAPL